jgi:uncharacterized membrane protein YfcA
VELLAGYTAFQIGVALAATFIGAFVRGLAGFGLAIVLVPVLALALTPLDAVLITNCLALCIGMSEIRRFLADAERSALTIAGLVLLTTAPGMLLLAATPADLARFLVAMVAISAFVAILLPQRAAPQPSRATTGLVGIASGLLTGFAGMPGPPVVPYYVGRAIPREVAKASMLLIFTIASLAGLVSGAAIGQLDLRLVWLALLLFPVVLIGNFLGARAFGSVSERLWRLVVAVVLGVTASLALSRLAFP